jgi:predicted translin family RNA/ssDNA-binding protein
VRANDISYHTYLQIRAKSRDEAFRTLNEVIRDGRQHIYTIAESVEAKREKKERNGWIKELGRQLCLLFFGSKRR